MYPAINATTNLAFRDKIYKAFLTNRRSAVNFNKEDTLTGLPTILSNPQNLLANAGLTE